MLNGYTLVLFFLFFFFLFQSTHQSSTQHLLNDQPAENKIIDKLIHKRTIASSPYDFEDFILLKPSEQESLIREEFKLIREYEQQIKSSKNKDEIDKMRKQLSECRKKISLYLELHGDNYRMDGPVFVTLKPD